MWASSMILTMSSDATVAMILIMRDVLVGSGNGKRNTGSVVSGDIEVLLEHGANEIIYIGMSASP